MSDLHNWDAIWNEQMALASRKWEDEHFWYERTQLPPIGLKTSNYAEELISRIGLSPEDWVLDIGCGDGAIAIRIAKRVKRVTALDSNPNLLFPVTQRAIAEGITNLKFVNLDWMEARIGPDIQVHDIVLASRFRQITNVRKFLEQMHAAARVRCYLTWIAERDEMDARVCQILGKEYHSLPDYSIVANLLYSMGIDAEVEIFETAETHRFESEQQAIEHTVRGYEADNPVDREQIIESVRAGLQYREGYWWKETPAQWALICWET